MHLIRWHRSLEGFDWPGSSKKLLAGALSLVFFVLAPRGGSISTMRRLLVLGILSASLTNLIQADWISAGSTVNRSVGQGAASLSGLASVVGERSVVAVVARAKGIGNQGYDLSSLPPAQRNTSAASGWQDAQSIPAGSLETVTTEVFSANQFEVPEAGTWAAGVLIAGVALVGYRSRTRVG